MDGPVASPGEGLDHRLEGVALDIFDPLGPPGKRRIRAGEDTRAAVAASGPVLPASLPQFVACREKVLGRVVTVIVSAAGRKAHATGAAVEIPGDDIPADPAFGEMVERREPARELI